MFKKWLPLFIGFCSLSAFALAQPAMDTLRLPLQSAEKMFLDSNLQLLAQRYNIDANQALVIQARLWPNPNFQVSSDPIEPSRLTQASIAAADGGYMNGKSRPVSGRG